MKNIKKCLNYGVKYLLVEPLKFLSGYHLKKPRTLREEINALSLKDQELKKESKSLDSGLEDQVSNDEKTEKILVTLYKRRN